MFIKLLRNLPYDCRTCLRLIRFFSFPQYHSDPDPTLQHSLTKESDDEPTSGWSRAIQLLAPLSPTCVLSCGDPALCFNPTVIQFTMFILCHTASLWNWPETRLTPDSTYRIILLSQSGSRSKSTFSSLTFVSSSRKRKRSAAPQPEHQTHLQHNVTDYWLTLTRLKDVFSLRRTWI